ncbi:hypothetical protein MSPP1_004139 [Malassezia sp. CBS 17886]|nr:hypothetical protein MSPP1_004139 [Malassezia sp. CBS 17886]
MTPATDLLSKPLVLQNGATMPNRLAKAPMEEVMAKFGGGPPNAELFELYRAWADAGWGMIITGNVGVDRRFLGVTFDVTFPDPGNAQQKAEYLEEFKKYARVSKGYSITDDSGDHDVPGTRGKRPLAVAQIVHAGRQSPRAAGRPPWVPAVAPSAVPMRSGEKQTMMDYVTFGVPRALTVDEIKDIIERFVRGAEFCVEAGFDGIELHAAHGYLLSSFLSPTTNQRTDEYGGSAEGCFRIVREIIEQTRRRVPAWFVVGIKLNSSDYIAGGLSEDDALQNVGWLAAMGNVDFVELSGGSYEKPEMVKDVDMSVSARTKRREGFFTAFAQRCHEVIPASSRMRIIVTGGFRTRVGMARAIEAGDADAVGLGRPASLDPTLPRAVLDPSIPDADERTESPSWQPPKPPAFFPRSPIVGTGWSTFWYSAQLHLIGRRLPTTPVVSMLGFVTGLRLW